MKQDQVHLTLLVRPLVILSTTCKHGLCWVLPEVQQLQSQSLALCVCAVALVVAVALGQSLSDE